MTDLARKSNPVESNDTGWTLKDYPQCDRVISKIIDDKAKALPNHIIFQFGDEPISFQLLNASINQAANGFRELGVDEGQNVAVMLPNCAEHLYCWFGLNRIGAVDVPINTAQRGSSLAYQIDYADCVGLVIYRDYLEHVEKIIDQLPKLGFIVIVDREQQTTEAGNYPNLKTLLYSEFSKQPDTAAEASGCFKDLSSILYTSGTTGRSKGVMISHHYWYRAAMSLVEFCRITNEDVLYTAMPFFHSAARGMTILPAILADSKAVIVERFSASQMFNDVRRWNCTVVNYIGGMVSILMKQDEKPDDWDNPVRLMVGAAAPVQLWDAFQKRFDVSLLELYGATECLFNLVNPYDARRPGSCGKPINGYRVKLVDENDEEVETGTVGEVIVQPESMYLGTSGYYKMPSESMELMKNFWFHTGDLARQDEDGYFYYADRKKQAIRRRGENISSFEVEGVINEHDSVMESCVVGVPSDLGEEDVKAVVVLKEGHTLPYADLIAWCKARMAYFCVPRYIAYRDSLPKTPSDRVEKYKLKDEGVTKDCWDVELSGISVKP